MQCYSNWLDHFSFFFLFLSLLFLFSLRFLVDVGVVAATFFCLPLFFYSPSCDSISFAHFYSSKFSFVPSSNKKPLYSLYLCTLYSWNNFFFLILGEPQFSENTYRRLCSLTCSVYALSVFLFIIEVCKLRKHVEETKMKIMISIGLCYVLFGRTGALALTSAWFSQLIFTRISQFSPCKYCCLLNVNTVRTKELSKNHELFGNIVAYILLDWSVYVWLYALFYD